MKDELDAIRVSLSGALHPVGKQSKPPASLERRELIPQGSLCVRGLHMSITIRMLVVPQARRNVCTCSFLREREVDNHEATNGFIVLCHCYESIKVHI